MDFRGHGITDFTTADADFAIRYGRGSYDGLKSEKLLEETVLPVCSPKLLEGADAIKSPAIYPVTLCCMTKARRMTLPVLIGAAGCARAE